GDEAPDDCPNTLPPPAPHAVDGDAYDFELWYEGYFNPPSGYSPLYCSRYDYTAKDVELQDPNRGNVQMASRFYRIGPKAH
ncbi:MAG: hypothetical protein GY849_14435, partial [Deltaproteobacteria bacterium]|nr:hypothetical protein [Deltaproteobacteria bacterium]